MKKSVVSTILIVAAKKEARNAVGENGLLESLFCRNVTEVLGLKSPKCCKINRSSKPLLRRGDAIPGKKGLVSDKISIKNCFRPKGYW